MNFNAHYTKFTTKLRRIPAQACIMLVRIYQYTLSPLKPHSSCCFLPSCSHYAIQALQRHGAVKGSWLACKRIMRCHSKKTYSVDEVPE